MAKQPVPARGEVIRRPPSKQPDDDSVPGFEGATNFVDGVLGFFEGVGRERAKIVYTETSNTMPCAFCTEPTKFRLSATRRGEESRIALCDVCKESIGQA